MTSAARLVLADSEDALKELIECDVDLDKEIGAMRRRRWIAVTALLRAVGHVLDKVDGESSQELRRIISAEWEKVQSTKPEPAILWGFIENERNTIVKQYKFRSRRHAVGQGAASISVATVTGIVTVKANKWGEVEFRILTDGPFAGRNDIEVAAEAIQWWGGYLARIESQIGSKT